ncbi:unnamed protein product [Prunus armeniaca]|uniref:Uncharacterized protein n=1 Tax=Prunus armeniaca TaxID=36596 RepID=A0A6J5Y6W1_PRUAR|nr:unnamed protein product [Prunus armeniaca]
MAKENESASQATVNGDNTLTRSTMSSIGEEDAFCLGNTWRMYEISMVPSEGSSFLA